MWGMCLCARPWLLRKGLAPCLARFLTTTISASSAHAVFSTVVSCSFGLAWSEWLGLAMGLLRLACRGLLAAHFWTPCGHTRALSSLCLLNGFVPFRIFADTFRNL